MKIESAALKAVGPWLKNSSGPTAFFYFPHLSQKNELLNLVIPDRSRITTHCTDILAEKTVI